MKRRATQGTARCRPRASCVADAARAGGLRACHSWSYQQASRQHVGRDRAHRQSPPSPGDGENASPILGGACIRCRTGRRLSRLTNKQPSELILFLATSRGFGPSVGVSRMRLAPLSLNRLFRAAFFFRSPLSLLDEPQPRKTGDEDDHDDENDVFGHRNRSELLHQYWYGADCASSPHSSLDPHQRDLLFCAQLQLPWREPWR